MSQHRQPGQLLHVPPGWKQPNQGSTAGSEGRLCRSQWRTPQRPPNRRLVRLHSIPSPAPLCHRPLAPPRRGRGTRRGSVRGGTVQGRKLSYLAREMAARQKIAKYPARPRESALRTVAPSPWPRSPASSTMPRGGTRTNGSSTCTSPTTISPYYSRARQKIEAVVVFGRELTRARYCAQERRAAVWHIAFIAAVSLPRAHLSLASGLRVVVGFACISVASALSS